MSLIDPLIGYTPTGIGSPYQSQVIVGKDLSLSFEAIGFGPNSRPDLVEGVRLNLTLISGNQQDGGPQKMASLSFSANDISAIIDSASTLVGPVPFQLVEVIVCNNGQSGRMMVLGSPVYT